MKKLILLFSIIGICTNSFSDIYTDVYDMTLRARIPRVYDNMSSMGSRKYQMQTIKGHMFVQYDDSDNMNVYFDTFTNRTYSIGGTPVTYKVLLNEDALINFSWCGSNKTQKFTKPNCNFSIEMIPSYKIGDEMLDDIHLQIACVSGNISHIKVNGCYAVAAYYMNGYCTGQIGCNCKAWGHISPTRFWGYWGPSEDVTDIASVNGQVQLKLNKSLSRK